MDVDLFEELVSSQAHTSINEVSQSQSNENKTKKSKSSVRPGPLYKKQKWKTLEVEPQSIQSSGEKNSHDPQSSGSGRNVSPEVGNTRILEASPKLPIHERPPVKVKPRPGPLSKKLKQQECLKPRPTLPPLPMVKIVEEKDNCPDKNANSDDEVKIEVIASSAPGILLATASVESTILHKLANKSIQNSKPTARPCPRSKKSEVVKDVPKHTDSDSKNLKSKSMVLLKASSDCTPTLIKHKKQKVVHSKENNTQAESSWTSNKTDPSTFSQTTNQHDLQLIKWKEGILKLQQEIGVPNNFSMVMDAFSTKKLMAIQKSLNANKPLYFFELILPHIWMDLQLKDLLNCREVCGRWNRAVDKFLGKFHSHPGKGKEKHLEEIDFTTNRFQNVFNRHPFEDRYGKQCSTYKFSSFEKVQAFISKVKDHPGNPFITKSVLLRAGLELTNKELSAFLDGVSELFRIYGQNILYLHLDIQGYHSIRKTFEMIHQVLTLVPNLNSLRLMCHIKDTSTDDQENEQLVHNSLPHLPNLETLDLCDAKLPINLIGLLIKKYSSSLLKLQVSLYRWNEMFSHQIPNLSELSITAMCSQDNLHHLYSQLQNLQRERLTKISLIVMVTLNTKRLFGILQNFKRLRTIKIIILENLGTKLHFQNGNPGSDDNITESLPTLPQIHSLELSLTFAQTSLTFLKWFPNLQSLHFSVDREYIENMPSENSSVSSVKIKNDKILRSVKRCIVKKSGIESRVWALLPSLQGLTVESDCYKRSQKDLCFTRDLFQ